MTEVCFQEFPENPSLKQIMLTNVANLDTREALLEHFQLPLEVLKVLCAKVCYLDAPWNRSEGVLKEGEMRGEQRPHAGSYGAKGLGEKEEV